MLKDGKFIKENPIKIGSHYAPPFFRTVTHEEQYIQNVILGKKHPNPKIKIIKFINKILG
jgi:hypothetical protein